MERLIKKLENLWKKSSINNPIYAPRFTPRLWLTCSLERLNHWKFKLSKKVRNSLLFQNKFLWRIRLPLWCRLCTNFINLFQTQKNLGFVLLIHFTIIKKKANPPANIKPANLRDLRILSNHRKDPSIIITKADKSDSLVVMDTKDYDTKIYTHLNEKTTYKTITHDHTDQFANIIIKKLKDLKQNSPYFHLKKLVFFV